MKPVDLLKIYLPIDHAERIAGSFHSLKEVREFISSLKGEHQKLLQPRYYAPEKDFLEWKNEREQRGFVCFKRRIPGEQTRWAVSSCTRDMWVHIKHDEGVERI